jgi:hypothetical protein
MKKILFMILVVMVALASCDVMPQISDIDGDGIADELDNLDDRLVGTWTDGFQTLTFNSNGNLYILLMVQEYGKLALIQIAMEILNCSCLP